MTRAYQWHGASTILYAGAVLAAVLAWIAEWTWMERVLWTVALVAVPVAWLCDVVALSLLATEVTLAKDRLRRNLAGQVPRRLPRPGRDLVTRAREARARRER